MRAVVLVSGGGAVTPFTTPEDGARRGLAAGNTFTALREHLVASGTAVFTTPARIGAGEAADDPGWQGFSDAPLVLPADLTVNAVGDIDDAGAALGRAIDHLREAFGITRLDLVAHSMGGLFSRAALRWARDRGEALPVDRLITLGTPWTGSLLGDFVRGDLSLADAHGDATTERILTGARAYAQENSQGAGEQASARYLAGADGWNARQAGILDGVAVTVLAGRYFDAAASPASLWPHDGLVALGSARADDVPAQVAVRRAVAEFDDVHSIFFAEANGLPWERALTWDPAVFAAVDAALAAE